MDFIGTWPELPEGKIPYIPWDSLTGKKDGKGRTTYTIPKTKAATFMEMMTWSWISYEPLKFKNLELSYTSCRCYQSSTSASLTSKAAWRSGPNCHWLASVLRWDSPPNAEIRGTSLWVVKGRHFGGEDGPPFQSKHAYVFTILVDHSFSKLWNPMSGIHFKKKSQVISTINLGILQVHPATPILWNIWDPRAFCCWVVGPKDTSSGCMTDI